MTYEKEKLEKSRNTVQEISALQTKALWYSTFIVMSDKGG